MGSRTLRATGHHPGGDGRGRWHDRRSAAGAGRRLDWPTLVIEAGHSESLTDLREDMTWWFGASDHQVNIIILAKSDHSNRAILLEKWVEARAQPRSGALTTRAGAHLAPTCSQVITIAQSPGIADQDPDRSSPSSYAVARGALRLEFGLLFLREPGSGEGDIVIGIPELQQYAAGVWEVVV